MSEVPFKKSRFDPDNTPLDDLAKRIAKAFGYASDLTMDKHLAQLLRSQPSRSI
ncbi:MAG: hypothetical protein ACJAXX_001078 [Roseivirga sp.]|jgi:hypothetical protein